MINIALVHYPCLNKPGETVKTAAFPLDTQDIARSCATFGVNKFIVIHPEAVQREFLKRVTDFWSQEEARQWNKSRNIALSLVSIVENLDQAREMLDNPIIVTTSARQKHGKMITCSELSAKHKNGDNILLLLGTGYGLHQSVVDESDWLLEPILGTGDYNHLSVRSAAAIILSRIA